MCAKTKTHTWAHKYTRIESQADVYLSRTLYTVCVSLVNLHNRDFKLNIKAAVVQQDIINSFIFFFVNHRELNTISRHSPHWKHAAVFSLLLIMAAVVFFMLLILDLNPKKVIVQKVWTCILSPFVYLGLWRLRCISDRLQRFLLDLQTKNEITAAWIENLRKSACAFAQGVKNLNWPQTDTHKDTHICIYISIYRYNTLSHSSVNWANQRRAVTMGAQPIQKLEWRRLGPHSGFSLCVNFLSIPSSLPPIVCPLATGDQITLLSTWDFLISFLAMWLN